MSNERLQEFPEVTNKLGAPSKKSLFERQKAEAEAKRLKEQQETAAVYEDFVKSFDDEGEDTAPKAGPPSAFPKRHFGPGRGARSGPGSLGPPTNSLRKRSQDSAPRDRLGSAFQSDDEDQVKDEKAPKPTLYLSSLPPGISPAAIKSVIPNLKVEAVKILNDRRGQSAIVTVAVDTPAGDIDAVVSTLQKKYLGRGYYLELSRHLSSAVAGNLPNSNNAPLPFGAKPAQLPGPQRGRGRFPSPNNRAPPVHVSVKPPTDLKQIKLIHKTIESVIKHGPEFEALLMSRTEVRQDEKWAWLWDSTCDGGVWYRWRLWDIMTNARWRQKTKRGANDGQSQIVFDTGAPWTSERLLPFEYTTDVKELVSDEDYNSSSDEDSGDDKRDESYLNPLHKAKLVHLLSRLPDTTAKLRRGDVARVTAFAIQHAGEGAEEVVDLLVRNIRSPMSLVTTIEDDPSQHKLVALYLISDILSSSSTSGVRHAWRYRQLFEFAFRSQHTFSYLGLVEKELQWGRLKAEKWKRAIGAIFGLWEGWCVFPAKTQEEFTEEFKVPVVGDSQEKEQEERLEKEKSKSKWKSLQVADIDQEDEAMDDLNGEPMDEDLDGEPMDEDLDGVPMDDSEEDIDMAQAVPAEPDISATQVERGSSPPAERGPSPQAEVNPPQAEPGSSPDAAARRRRPRAEDMFADSDGE